MVGGLVFTLAKGRHLDAEAKQWRLFADLANNVGMAPKALKLGVLDGKTYALPYTISTPILFYNADLFKAAGLDPQRPPQT